VSIDSTVTHVIAAVAVILGLSYVAGQLFRRLGQPEVIGQLFAGIVLGPSLLERFFGSITRTLFPASVVAYLYVIAQVALVLFLFGIGYELDLRLLSRRRGTVSAVSGSAFVVPMTLGAASAYVFGHWYRTVGESRTGTGSFMLFMGIALSVTAVPVLASLIRERGIEATPPGVTAMTSAALIDALCWLALAGVLVMAGVSPAHRTWPVTVLLLIGYVLATAFVVRPAMLRWWRRPNALMASKVPVSVAFAMSSAWATAALGLHVIFGAFFAGLIMPRQANGVPDEELLRPIKDAGRVLLPIFFVLSGLSVNLVALRARDLALFGVLLTIAVVGKIGAGFLAARITKMNRRDSATVGILINTRGLTEIIVLNTGLQAGIIHQHLYTILILMALVTTAGTAPLLTLIRPQALAGASASSVRTS
jgi:Kef-type K+ transport system membrane component KefB